MLMRQPKIISLALVGILAIGCTGTGVGNPLQTAKPVSDSQFLASGTIILSRRMPDGPALALADKSENTQPYELMTPILGYTPTGDGFLPAMNETWLEIERVTNTLVVHRGNTIMKTFTAEGTIPSEASGVYALQQKQKDASWYAPDEYFSSRKLELPEAGAKERYLRGALGPYALFPSANLPIYSGPMNVGEMKGLRVSPIDLASIYYMLPVGSPIVIK